MQSLPIFGLGIFFALAGVGLAALTLRKAPAGNAPVRKSDLRAQETEQRNTTKLRIAAMVLGLVGVALIVLS